MRLLRPASAAVLHDAGQFFVEETTVTDESLFREALARPDPHERAAFLDEACAGKSQLRAAVEALLAAHETAPGSPPMPLSRAAGTTGDYAPEPEGAVSTTAESPRATADPPAAADVVVVAGG